MVGEAVALVVGPEDLLSDQVLHPTALEDLGQRRRITEGIRQPQHHAIHTQGVLVVAFTMHQLTDEGFTAGHVGVGLHPHRAFSDPLAALDGFPDAFVQLRIMLAAHFISGGLALDELVLRILLNQPQLLSEGSAGFAVGFRCWPQPR